MVFSIMRWTSIWRCLKDVKVKKEDRNEVLVKKDLTKRE